MGRDKTQLVFKGATLLERTLGQLRSAGFLPAVAGLRERVPCSAPCAPDAFPGFGPLAGIEAALRSLAVEPSQPVLFVPVDLPLLPQAFLKLLYERAQLSGALATVPLADGRPQPLCAVYRSELAPGVAEALRRDDRKVIRVIKKLAEPHSLDCFRVEALAVHHGWRQTHRWFWNLNTPADWKLLLDLSESSIPASSSEQFWENGAR